VTPEQQEAVLGLVFVPGSGRRTSPDDVLRRFGTSDGVELGATLLRDAVRAKDAAGVEYALIVCTEFGITTEHLPFLQELALADWHVKHEDVVSALGELRAPEAVDALYQSAQWIPGYLDFDDSRALATKAVRALGGISGAEAEQALRRLLESDSQIVREGAEKQLARRSRPGAEG
jgi:HEAT repeat protein